MDVKAVGSPQFSARVRHLDEVKPSESLQCSALSLLLPGCTCRAFTNADSGFCLLFETVRRLNDLGFLDKKLRGTGNCIFLQIKVCKYAEECCKCTSTKVENSKL